MFKKFTILLLLILPLKALYAQSPLVSVPLVVADSAGVSSTLYFGLDSAATDGLDARLGEQSLPPLPPSGAFDARFLLPSSTDASLRDYRKGNAAFDGVVVYEIQYQPSAGSFVVVSGDMPAGVAARLQDEITGSLIDVSLTGQSKYTVQNATAINRLKLTVSYSLDKTAPAAPQILSPVDDATNEPVNETFVWSKVSNATSYTLQIAKNSSFNALVFSDSSLTDTTVKVTGLTGSATYYWRVKAKNAYGVGVFSPFFDFTTGPTAVKTEAPNVPDKFALNGNYPNPFNPATDISYELPVSSFVSLKVYDILGNMVARLVNETQPAGVYRIRFNAGRLNSGVYFARMEARGGSRSFVQVRKMIYMK
jgi:hypothetical protein